ncbi:hypothetical protein CEXT_210911 [Caerostris extrusa]|uniref:Uncharacterized protein n=1 Tax=Caerostris extrusa TaxID=172846 RepID=A0AAV4Y3X3_CAEEX|nr:hypothetical protein CEXT_210911 [Caerostris extrusa]
MFIVRNYMELRYRLSPSYQRQHDNKPKEIILSKKQLPPTVVIRKHYNHFNNIIYFLGDVHQKLQQQHPKKPSLPPPELKQFNKPLACLPRVSITDIGRRRQIH